MNTSTLSSAERVTASDTGLPTLTPDHAFKWLDLSGCLSEMIGAGMLTPRQTEEGLILDLAICPQHHSPILKPSNLCLMCTE